MGPKKGGQAPAAKKGGASNAAVNDHDTEQEEVSSSVRLENVVVGDFL